MKISNSILFTLIPFILMTGCDFDRYFGYQTKGQDLIDYTTINGKLTNRFTDEPVYGAHVIIDGLETYSGSLGDFKFIYPLTEDLNRTKPVDITILVEDYFPFHAERELYPDMNEFNFSLTYAAPIILDAAKVVDNKQFPFYYCQAIIRDYQGMGNMKKVTGVFPLTGKSNGMSSYRQELTLLEINPLDPTIGHFQAKIPFEISYDIYFFIEAEDRDGYSDEFQHAIDILSPDAFLFSPF